MKARLIRYLVGCGVILVGVVAQHRFPLFNTDIAFVTGMLFADVVRRP